MSLSNRHWRRYWLLVLLCVSQIRPTFQISDEVEGYYFLNKFIHAEKWNHSKNTIECWSNQGKWLNENDNITYYLEDFDTKMNWPAASTDCFKYYYQYRTKPHNISWVVDSDSNCYHHYHHRWSKDKFCRDFGGHNILLIGDSINIQLYQTLLLITTKDTSITSIDCSIELQSSAPIHSDVHYYTNDEYKANRDKILSSSNISLVIYNRGIHYLEGNIFISDLTEAFDFIQTKYPNISIIFRNTPVGHPNCGQQFNSEPLQIMPEISSLDAPGHPEFHWKEAAMQNELSQKLIREKYPNIVYWDVFRMTMLRQDKHCQYRGDCLHYCFHSVIDSWIIFLMNIGAIFSHQNDE